MYAGNQPVIILKEGTQRETGRNAQSSNITAARAIANTVKTTLGPRGMDKMLVDSMGDVVITNDGATILKEIDVAHPAAKMLIEVAKTQDEQCGDGTTTSVVLTGELLAAAQELLEQNVHSTTITAGYRIASEKAIEVLESIAKNIKITDKVTLQNIAGTSLASKAASGAGKVLSKIVVDAVTSVAETRDGETLVDLDNIQVQKTQGGTVSDTELIKGIVLDKERVHNGMPLNVEKAKIALVNAAFEIKKTEVDAKIQITDPSQLNSFLAEEESTLKKLVDAVVKVGANVVVCQKGIDDLAQHFLAKNGIYAVRRAKKSDLEKLAKATGGNIVNSVMELEKADLGSAGTVEERKVGDDKFTFVTECRNPKAVSILLRGGTEHVVDELERALNDALHVTAVALEDGQITPGGGAAASEIALRLREYAPSVGGREQMAVEAFADAIESIPRTLAENAGLDEIDIMIALRKAHKSGKKSAGVNVFTGKVEDMFKNNVIEPIRVGLQEINSSTEAATMILRIDDVIASKGGGGGGGAPGGGMPDMGGMGGMGGMDF
ncbi:MAG: TCP-1/cpn60 chaperonin family protein [Euryarchaeota archaeon]|nr:TCP-1/cpn60 chaperonin family protein [Euryarchaeota archaeon]